MNGTRQGRGRGARPVVLVVDDSRLILRIVRDHFEEHGYRVLEAPGGEEALRVVERRRPDVVVADVLMPGMDGWELFRRIRERPATADVPFVFLTVERSLAARLRGLREGADDWITKPFEVEELRARVERLLARYAATPELSGDAAMLSGSLTHFPMADLLQVLSMHSKTCLVKLSHGAEQGTIQLVDGRMVDATVGSVRGVKALFRMLAWEGATFRVEPDPPEPRNRTIEAPASTVVMDGLVSLDEWNRFREVMPEAAARLAIAPDARARLEGQDVHAAEFDVLSRSKTGRTVGEILDESPLPDGALARAICSLVDRGILTTP